MYGGMQQGGAGGGVSTIQQGVCVGMCLLCLLFNVIFFVYFDDLLYIPIIVLRCRFIFVLVAVCLYLSLPTGALIGGDVDERAMQQKALKADQAR